MESASKGKIAFVLRRRGSFETPPAIYPCSGTPSNKHLARIPQPRHVRFVRTLLLLIAWPIRRDFADTRALPVRAPGIPPSCAIATT